MNGKEIETKEGNKGTKGIKRKEGRKEGRKWRQKKVGKKRVFFFSDTGSAY